MRDLDRMVFQMRLAIEGEKLGWTFTAEDDEVGDSQAFVFTLPLDSESDDWRKHSYKFPGLREDRYAEFVAEPDGDILAVVVDGTRVRFATLTDFEPPVPVDGRPLYRPLPYVGAHSDLVADFKLFLPIYSVDTAELDGLLEKQTILVGLTPQFRPS